MTKPETTAPDCSDCAHCLKVETGIGQIIYCRMPITRRPPAMATAIHDCADHRKISPVRRWLCQTLLGHHYCGPEGRYFTSLEAAKKMRETSGKLADTLSSKLTNKDGKNEKISAALCKAFPHFSDTEEITPEAIAKIGANHGPADPFTYNQASSTPPDGTITLDPEKAKEIK
jgi:hypothetical protein